MKLSRRARFALAVLVVGALALLPSCKSQPKGRRPPAPAPAPAPVKKSGDPTLTLVTGYCNCEKCCGWERSWFGFGAPVYASGRLKGKPKRVGVTASGKMAHRGTIAADPKVYPFGTKLVVPGYGTGVVEDTGGSIRGNHIDIWFPTHDEAKRWGRKWLKLRH